MKKIIKLGLGAALMLPLSGAAANAQDSGAPAPKTIWFVAPVPLRSAGYFTILSQAGISDVPTSAIVGNVAVTPITGAADLLTCSEVTGKVYAPNVAGPRPCNIKDPVALGYSLHDMYSAYANAANRPPQFTNLGGGEIGGLTLVPGVYKWTTGVSISTDVTLKGSATGVWIFQIAGTLDMASAKAVVLLGGPEPRNIFWQVAGQTTLGTYSHFQGTILDKTAIAMKTGAALRGRLLAQTAVTLEQNHIVGLPQ